MALLAMLLLCDRRLAWAWVQGMGRVVRDDLEWPDYMGGYVYE